ncbi:MAG TPA: single-stranded-DNA-specific exonuclease RecJ [Bryobacteraceae bacterium]|nr:single-stranded-DNA-specific exonuclease RecJ [Bryobacteraceae bacterium]
MNIETAVRRAPARWIRSQVAPEIVTSLAKGLRLSTIAASILAARGYADLASASEFVNPRLDDLHDPLLLADMDRAAARLRDAIRSGEPVLLYGDYDVDGTCSIVVLKRAIELLGGRADFHVPHRLKDGYGMRSEVVSRAAESGVRLIVSVDTGIRAGEVVRHANALGIDVIVTDHHLPEKELPPALAVLNPNRPDCRYPNKNLCGAGVTLKLIQALLVTSDLTQARRTALLDSFLKPVAIATVADIVPLTGENRIIVKRGLSGLQQVRNPGLKALLAVAGFEAGETPSAHQVAFRIAPRINAAGRMATARDVVDLFLTDDFARAQSLAEQLDRLNSERQQVEAEIVETILKQCEEQPLSPDCAGLVFAGSGWHLGVLGIVASRLVERFTRPVFVLSESTEQDEHGGFYFAGSGRSIPAFHLLEALESMPELFRKFGGHRQAAGLTLSAHAIEDFRARFDQFAAARLTVEDFRPEFKIDAEVTLPELNDRCANDVLSLGPFGFGNPMPVLSAEALEVAGPVRTSANGKHLTVPFRQNGRTLFVKAWNFADRADLFAPGKRIDVLLQIEDDAYSRRRGYGSWCLSLKDARPSA